jgi:hypothetical protein
MPTKRQRPLRWDFIRSNIAEAREQLQQLEAMATAPDRNEGGLEVGLAHAYHHLNFAWNSRRMPFTRVAACAAADFNEWGRFPRDIDLPRVKVPGKTKSGSRSGG